MNRTNWLLTLLGAFVAGLLIFTIFAPESTEAPVNDNSDIIDTDDNVDDNNDSELPVSRVGELSDKVIVNTPRAGATVASPIAVTGEAPGNWFFEATAPVVVVNWDGLIIGEGYITAEGEWMTTELVPFSGEIEYDLPADSYSTRGALILQRSNASDLPENDAAIEIPINLEA